MGENEQGGMLRTIVILGLIGLIAAVVIGATLTLKGKMSERSNQATNRTEQSMAADGSTKSKDANSNSSQDTTFTSTDTVYGLRNKAEEDHVSSDQDAWLFGAKESDVHMNAHDEHGLSVVSDERGDKPVFTPLVKVPDKATQIRVTGWCKTAANNYHHKVNIEPIGFYFEDGEVRSTPVAEFGFFGSVTLDDNWQKVESSWVDLDSDFLANSDKTIRLSLEYGAVYSGITVSFK